MKGPALTAFRMGGRHRRLRRRPGFGERIPRDAPRADARRAWRAGAGAASGEAPQRAAVAVLLPLVTVEVEHRKPRARRVSASARARERKPAAEVRTSSARHGVRPCACLVVARRRPHPNRGYDELCARENDRAEKTKKKEKKEDHNKDKKTKKAHRYVEEQKEE